MGRIFRKIIHGFLDSVQCASQLGLITRRHRLEFLQGPSYCTVFSSGDSVTVCAFREGQERLQTGKYGCRDADKTKS